MSTQDRLVARHTVTGDPEPRLGVDIQHWLTRQKAATALALVYAHGIIHTSRNALQQGLNQAVSQRLLDNEQAVADVSTARVAGYIEALDKHSDFFFRPGNVDVDSGEPVTRVEVRHLFTLDEAATALAVVYAGKSLHRWGKNTVTRALREAAQNDLLTNDKAAPNSAVADFRSKLLDLVAEFREFHGSEGQASS